MTAFSPKFMGAIASRRSKSAPVREYCLKTMRPSCGMRCSAMSRLAMIFRRATMGAMRRAGLKRLTTRMSPSTR